MTYPVTLQNTMWCIYDGAYPPIKATIATVTDTAKFEYKGLAYCNNYPYQYDTYNGWCSSGYNDAGNWRQAFLATYTPPANAPTSIPTSTGTLACPIIVSTSGNYPLYLQGNWCLPPGMDMPVLAINNQCSVGGFREGWCIQEPTLLNGQPYGAVKPVDPLHPPFDAADSNRFDYVAFTYSCPADTYHPVSYSVSGSALGVPKAPFTATSPCLSLAKAREMATCGSGASGFSNEPAINYSRADMYYNQCLADNSTAPYKERYQAMALAASDTLDFFMNACTYPQVKRDGVCVDQTVTVAVPGTTSSAADCLTAYQGPDTDPQVDSYCKLAAFDACLHKATALATYDAEGRAACSTLSGLLSAIGAGNTYSCVYCPYPY